MSALDNDQSYGFAMLAPVGVGDLNGDFSTAKGFTPGQTFFAQSPWGMRTYMLVQNRHTAVVVKGALLRGLGGNNGYTQVTTSGAAGVNTKIKATTSGLTANNFQGCGFYVQNSLGGAGTAPENEDGVVAGNSTTEIYLEPGHPLSATLTPGDTINVHSVYTAELSAANDLTYAVLGVVVGKDGISPSNFGFVARNGYTPNVLIKAGTGLNLSDALIADVGRAGPALGSTAAANMQIGTARHAKQSDAASTRTSVILALGLGFNPGTVDASA